MLKDCSGGGKQPCMGPGMLICDADSLSGSCRWYSTARAVMLLIKHQAEGNVSAHVEMGRCHFVIKRIFRVCISVRSDVTFVHFDNRI